MKRLLLILALVLFAFSAYAQTQPVITEVTAVDGTFDQLTVKWSAAVGADFTDYRVQIRKKGDLTWTDQKILGKTATEVVYSGLDQGTTYQFHLLAFLNDQGWGWSQSVEGTTNAPKPRTFIEYRNEDGDIQEFNSMGKNPPLQFIQLRISTLERTPMGGIDIRDFVEPYGYDLRVKSVNGDEIAKVGSKFYMRMMLRAEFERLGWHEDEKAEAQWNGNRRQEKHPFFWKLNGDPSNMRQWKNKAWGWEVKPTEAWFRISVNFDKCKCGIDDPLDFSAQRSPGMDGSVYYLVMQVKVKRPGKSHVIDNRIPFGLTIGGNNAPDAPPKPGRDKLATTWGALKAQ